MEVCSDVRFKQRAVIEFLTAEQVPPVEIHRRLQAIYGDQCIGESGTHYWCSWIPKSLKHFFNTTTPGLTQVQQQEMQFNAWTFQCSCIHL
jgi:hypothetical protein